jgi:hypothetical protein
VYAGANTIAPRRCGRAGDHGRTDWDLWPGPVDRWDEGNVIRVALYGGALASVTRDDVLNGANAFAIEADGEWEIVQAAQCELVAPNTYELRGFLRGRQGSAHAMQAPHPVGARIVKLDQRLARAEIAAHEWHEPLSFVAPPAGAAPSSNRAAVADLMLPHAARRPWAPAHLRAVRDGAGDVPSAGCAAPGSAAMAGGRASRHSASPSESYVLDILDGGVAVRSVTTSIPSFVYSAAAQTADFGSLPGSLHFRVAQIGESGATGLNSELTITL